MKKKTINKILEKKFNEWANSIEDEKVKALVRRDTIITGGSITSLLLKEPPKDYDIYFKTKEAVLAVANYYVNIFNKNTKHDIFVLHGDMRNDKPENGPTTEDHELLKEADKLPSDRVKIFIKSKGVAAEDDNLTSEPFDDVYDVLPEEDEELEVVKDNGKYRPIFMSSNAITLSNKIQLVIRFYGQPEEIHDNYDFVHCTNYWTNQEKTVLNQGALEAILAKELVYMGSKYPLCSIIRTRKFIKRGWHINAGQYVKMAFQISKMDLENIEVLEDQLVGVDSAYFGMLISSLKQAQEKNVGTSLNMDYITSIINRIF